MGLINVLIQKTRRGSSAYSGGVDGVIGVRASAGADRVCTDSHAQW